MDYKSTLNLPQTDFPMKANLSEREPQALAFWEKIALSRLLRQRAPGRPLFILHDGPPYANGHIHIGHALNKILKDMIVRYKFLRGYDVSYIPGWDCHGLPVEHQLFKDLGKTKDEVDRVAFRRLAHDFAMKFVGIQKEEFKRLGVLGDWEHPYLTQDAGYEERILLAFAELVEKGYIYRGLKPVNWCFKCETALAEAEVEYADHESDSVIVAFELRADKRLEALGVKPGQKASALIWTTTPWTLLANVAVAVHPALEYVLLVGGNEAMIMGRDLFYLNREKLGFQNHEVISQFKGQDLEGLIYEHPFGSREGRVVLADYVSKEEGTGCVHTAPGHGQEDFATGLKYKLDVLMPVDGRGRFDKSAGDFCGLHVFDANEKIIAQLRMQGALKHAAKIAHSYPHCWRCKTPVIFRATQQWFLKVDHVSLRQRMLEVIRGGVRWIPSAGEGRIGAMIESRPDWCLSRQRLWGVPIPAVVCAACGSHILDARVVRILASRAVKEGADAWFKSDAEEFLPQDFSCSCGGRIFEKSTDILDVWFDSGVSHQAVLKGRPGLRVPADLYLEGSDQHRGWFQSSLIVSMALDGKPPFASVLTHGFVVDGEGRKMSKSLGNVVAPQEVIKACGADVLRLWVASSDYNEDVRISQDILRFITDAYRKVRNTARFLLGNLSGFDPDRDSVSKDAMLDIDKWALFRLSRLLDDVQRGYEEYQFYVVFQQVYNFCNEEMSSFYLDILKDRLYTSARSSSERRSAQTTLYEILSALMRILAPVIPFTCEEIYRYMPKPQGGTPESVHLLFWPVIPEHLKVSEAEVCDMAHILALRPQVLKALEAQRAGGAIGSSLEAKVIVTCADASLFEKLRAYEDQLPYLFIVSQVEIRKTDDKNAFDVVSPEGGKCVRCWNYHVKTDADTRYPGLCPRCVRAVGASLSQDVK